MSRKKRQAGMSAKHAGRHHLPEIHGEFRDEGEKPDREGRCIIAVDQHQREEQLAPGGGEDEAERGRNAGQRQRQDDLPEGRELGGAVDHRRLFEILRNAVEEGLHQEGREGHVEGGVDDDEAGQAVGQVAAATAS